MEERPANANGRDAEERRRSAPLAPANAFSKNLSTGLPDAGAFDPAPGFDPARGFDPTAGQGGGPSGGRPLTLNAFRQVKWWVIGVAVVLAVGITPWVWVFMAPYYLARGVVRVSPVVSRIVFNTEDNGMLPLYQSFMNTQVSIIRNPVVLERVLDRADIRKTRWYNRKDRSLFRTPLSRLERLQQALTVRPRKRTELIDVSTIMLSAEDAQVIANAIVDEYKRYTDESFREQDIRRTETLRDSRTALQREIAGLVATKFSLSDRLGTTDPEDLRTGLAAELGALETRHAVLARQLAMAR